MLRKSSVIRAAIDLGSGATKMSVCEVDAVQNVVTKRLATEYRSILYGHDMKKRDDGMLSEEILGTGFGVLSEFKQVATSLGATKICGVATAAFRECKNGHSFIERIRSELGIDMRLVSQGDEAELGFNSALTASEWNREHLISWDSGGASFQITSRVTGSNAAPEQPQQLYQYFLGPLGTSKVTAMMVSQVQGKQFSQNQSANPSTIDNVHALSALIREILPKEAPEWLGSKLLLSDTKVVGIGEETCMFNIAHLAIGKKEFDANVVWKAIEAHVEKTDEEFAGLGFPQPDMVITKLTLLHTVLTTFKIPKVYYFRTNGSCDGILISDLFWKDE